MNTMDESTPQIETNPAILHAPLPTAKTLRRRRNVPMQLIRFASLNMRMAYLALRGHR